MANITEEKNNEHKHCNCSHEHHHEHKHCNCSHEHYHDDFHLEGCGCASCSTIKSGNFIQKHGFDLLKIAITLLAVLSIAIFRVEGWLQYLVGGVAIIPIGYGIVIDTVKGFAKKDFFNEKTLMLIASIGAIIIGEFFEGALVLSLFVVGQILEDCAVTLTEKSIFSLANIGADTARLVTNEGVKVVSAEEVKKEDILEVLSGEKLAVDGVLISDCATLDTRSVTGESLPVEVSNGGVVYSGMVNAGGIIKIKATENAENSMAKKIEALVKTATTKKSNAQRTVSSFAKIYTPIVVIVAVIVAITAPLFDGFNFSKWIYRSLSLLVISCPCSMVISVPLAYYSGIGALARKGLLIKGGYYLERLAKSNIFVFDKTGTITTGDFIVEKVIVKNGFCEEDVIEYSSALEEKSTHPLAVAIVKNSQKKYSAEKVEELLGKGIVGEVNGKKVAVGNRLLMKQLSIAVDEYFCACIYCVIDEKLAGVILLEDAIKSSAKQTISDLKKLGVQKTVMLSGDKVAVATKVANSISIDEVCAELLPNDKVEKLSELVFSNDGAVVYVGDGINDAPSIKLADVGFAMGRAGSALAVNSADVIVLNDDLQKLTVALKTAKRTRRIVWQNIVFSIAFKVAIAVTSFIIKLPVWLAVVADVGVMILAVLNSFRNNK